MKVLQITNNYPTTLNPIFGIFVKEQIESLKILNIESDLFFINGREKGKMEYLRSIIKLRKILKVQDYDVIHCHHAFSALVLILSGRFRGKNIVVSFQNDPKIEIGTFLFNFIKRHVKQIIVKHSDIDIKDSNLNYLPNGVNINFFINKGKKESCRVLNLNPETVYILFVSSNFIRKQKRHDRFNEVIRLLKTKYKLKNIEPLLLINTARDLVPYYFSAASLHLLTSDFEGSPNSVKESMSCGTPVVSTPVGNVSDIFRLVTNCFVSNSFDAEELALLCNKALKSQGNPREAIINGKLDINSVALKLKDIYIKAINN